MARPRFKLHNQGHTLKPFRDPTVHSWQVVACPVHGTPVGEQCRFPNGKVNSCKTRRRMAIRLNNEMREENT